MILPYYLVAGSHHVAEARYVVPLLPPLLILTGKLLSDLTGARSGSVRIGALALTGIVLTFSFLYTVAADLAFVKDSRRAALEWVVRNVREGASIEVTPYAPNIPQERYRLIRRPWNNKVSETAAIAKSSGLYRTAESVVSRLREASEKLSPRKREQRYQTWYDSAMAAYSAAVADFDVSKEGLEVRKPEYLIVSQFYFERFRNDRESAEGRFFYELFAGETNYEVVERFKYDLAPWLNPDVELVNPVLYVYKRRNTAEK
jgi:hypothetical protein